MKIRKGTAASLAAHLETYPGAELEKVRKDLFVPSWELLRAMYPNLSDNGRPWLLVRYLQACGRVRPVCAELGC